MFLVISKLILIEKSINSLLFNEENISIISKNSFKTKYEFEFNIYNNYY